MKIDEQLEELTEMYCPFVRGHYENNIDVPKSKLYEWLRKEHQDTPKYHTWQKDKMFRSIVLGKKTFSAKIDELFFIYFSRKK